MFVNGFVMVFELFLRVSFSGSFEESGVELRGRFWKAPGPNLELSRSSSVIVFPVCLLVRSGVDATIWGTCWYQFGVILIVF